MGMKFGFIFFLLFRLRLALLLFCIWLEDSALVNNKMIMIMIIIIIKLLNFQLIKIHLILVLGFNNLFKDYDFFFFSFFSLFCLFYIFTNFYNYIYIKVFFFYELI
jgi:hypothetical protein